MKAAGIIAEYNPFHEGHRYQIRKTRAITGADYIVIAMSGDFVQRGEPAVFDKYSRTRMALLGGADLVIELPSLAACASAEDFAACGVSLFDHLGCIDTLCFGSESGDIDLMNQAADLLTQEPEAYRLLLKQYLKQGEPFPKARALALADYLHAADSSLQESLLPILQEPNNILGIEYRKAMLRRQSPLQAVTIRRKGQAYHDSSEPDSRIYPSASSLRALLKQGAGSAYPDLTPVFPDDLSMVFNWELLRLLESGTDLNQFCDLSDEIAARLKNHALHFASFTKRVDQLKTRQYTYTRISRALTHMLLGFTQEDMRLLRSLDYAPYVRILGFRKSSSALLGMISRHSDLPLITKTADAEQRISGDAWRLFCKDLHASHLYQSVLSHKKGVCIPNEYTHPLVILP